MSWKHKAAAKRINAVTYSFSKHNVDTNEPELGRLRVKSRSVANGEFATHLDGWLNKCDLDKKVKEVVLFSDRSSTARASSSATERPGFNREVGGVSPSSPTNSRTRSPLGTLGLAR